MADGRGVRALRASAHAGSHGRRRPHLRRCLPGDRPRDHHSIITIVVYVPLNDAIKAAGDPDGITDLAAVGAMFDEHRWAAWNLVRVVAGTASFGRLARTLALHSRATG